MRRLQYSFIAALAASAALAEVDWTASVIAVNDGTESDPVALATEVVSSGELHVGKNAAGALAIVSGGSFSNMAAGKKICVGSAQTGWLSVQGGSLETRFLYVGDAGDGTLLVNGESSSVKADRTLVLGNRAGTTGLLEVSGGGSVTITREVTVGASGFGAMNLLNGAFAGRGFTVGSGASSTGIVTVCSPSTVSISENYSVTVGAEGNGTLRLAGGAFSPKNSRMSLIVRQNETAMGLVSGWGSISHGGSSSQRSHIENNGVIAADGSDDEGGAAERTLLFGPQNDPFRNNIENDSTNGWYAVNKGLLTLPHSSDDLPSAGDSGVCTWGEAEDDDAIDLVNSARVTFHAIANSGTESKPNGITGFTGNLYAADRSDVPALPGGAAAVGVWSFDISGLYETADFEFRYDHVKAPKGVKLYQLGSDGETWTKLETVGLDGYRAKVSGVAAGAPLMFAAVAASSSGTIVIIR